MTALPLFPGRLGIQQRVLTPYRAAFFDVLAASCGQGLNICAGLPRPQESIAVTDRLQKAAYTHLTNLHILKGRFYLCYQWGLLLWLSRSDPDALILEANPRYLAAPAAVRWMKHRSHPVLGWGLGVPSRHAPALAGRRRTDFIRQFDGLLTYSRRGAEEYASLGFPADRIFVAPNAATPRPRQPQPVRSMEFDGKASLLFVGRLQKRKRVDLLLQACAALPPDIQPQLVVVGDGPERSNLEALAKNIYPAAKFPGAVHGQELVPYFTAADLFVLPGTGGLAVQEAMSHGLPVIMGQGDGTNDDLVRPTNGWQIPPEDGPALLETLRAALVDAARLRSMGAESYRIVAEEINLEKMVEVFVNSLYQLTK